jgi:membrane protein YdbS with pleckstrin-like domain
VLELDPAHENAITAMGMGAEAPSRTYLFRVRPSLVPVLIWGFIGAGVFAALIAVFNVSIAGDPFIVSLANLILALVAAAFGVRVFLALLQRLFTRYTLGSEHLLVERGILSRSRKMIAIGRIQGVATRQSLIERPFGIGDVVVESAEEVGGAVLQDLARCKGYTDAILDAVQELSKPD